MQRDGDERPTPAAFRSKIGGWTADRKQAIRSDGWGIAYLLVFSLSAVCLLATATNGRPTVVVQAALVGFVGAATLWVRSQWVDSVRDEMWVLPGNITVGLVLSGIVLSVAWWIGRWDSLLLWGLYLVWIGGSAIVSRMRVRTAHGRNGILEPLVSWTDKHRGRLGLGAIIAALGLIILGVAVLGSGSSAVLITAGVMLVVAFLVALPVGVNLVSESMSSRFSAPAADLPGRAVQRTGGPVPAASGDGLPGRGWNLISPVGFFGAGVLGFTLVAVVAVRMANTGWVLLILGAVLVTMVAVVSSTHVDVVLIMAAVALLGVTPSQQPDAPDMINTGHRLNTLVAIGDSYMSGEGASIYYEGTDEGGGDQCRRAPTAWPAMAADMGFQALEFLACSGADTGNVLYPADSQSRIPRENDARKFVRQLDSKGLIRTQTGEPATQLEQWRSDAARRGLNPAMVVVSLGGNDAGFSTIGAMCLAPGDCSTRRDLWIGSLDQVRTRLRIAYLEIAETFPEVPVVTVGYPDPIADDRRCTQVSLTYSERSFVHDFLTGTPEQDGLNDVIRETSAEFGFHYVDFEGALRAVHLQLCDKLNAGRPGVNFVGLRSVRGASEQRFNPANWIHSSFHPNERGHAALLRSFQTWRAGQQQPLSPPVREPTAAAQAEIKSWSRNAGGEAATVMTKAGPCDLFETDVTGCRTQGQGWALQQVRTMVFERGLWFMLAAAIFSWLIAVGLLAQCRRWADRAIHRRTGERSGPGR